MLSRVQRGWGGLLLPADDSGKAGGIGESPAGAGCRAVVAKIAKDVDFLSSVLSGKARQRIGDDVAVMQVGNRRIAPHVKPQTMHKLNIVGT